MHNKSVNLAIATDRVGTAFRSRLLETKSTSFCNILLMILLCSVKFLRRQYLCNYFSIYAFLKLLQGFFCCFFLFRRVVVYSCAVMGSNIVALSIKLCRIDPFPKNFQQMLITALTRIVLNPNDLRMIRLPSTNILVPRLIYVPLTKPNLRPRNSRHSLERQLRPPETPRGELRELLPRRRNVCVRPLRDLCSGRGRGCG